jgi:hypothetical protein
MAILKSAQRKKLPGNEFAGPDRSYPIPDANHGRAALSMLHNAPESEQPVVKAKVKKKFPGIK